MTAAITGTPPTPATGALKLTNTNPPLVIEDAVDARHRAHCPMCSGDRAHGATDFVDALYRIHAPFLRDAGRPHLAQILTKRGEGS